MSFHFAERLGGLKKFSEMNFEEMFVLGLQRSSYQFDERNVSVDLFSHK